MNGQNKDDLLNNNVQNNNALHNKFFPEDINTDDKNNQVNSNISHNINSQIISKTSWDVGSHKKQNSEPEVLDFLEDTPNNIMKQVNTTIYDSNAQSTPNSLLSNPNSNNNIQNNQKAPMPPNNGLVMDENLINQQPLSASALGAAPIDVENSPKEVIVENKFINKDIPNKVEDIQPNIIPSPKPNISTMLEEQKPILDLPALNREYVGNAYQKITMSPFSFSAFIFGPIYFIYRKLLILGIILFAFDYSIIFIAPTPFSYIAFLVLRIIMALSVNQIYLKSTERKIKSLVKHNDKDDQYKLSIKCQKMGKTNFLLAFISLIASCIVIYISAIYIFPNSFLNNIFSYFTIPHTQNNNTNNKQEEKTEVIEIEKYNVLDLYNITIPDDFTKKETSGLEYSYSDQLASCSFSFNSIKGYQTSEELIKKLAENNNESSSTIESNNIKWSSLDIKKDNLITYYRVTMANEKIILFQYEIDSNNDNNICMNYYNTIFSSISLKE